MSNDLIKEMSARLGRSDQEVQKALSAFASAVNDRLQADGEANLAGLGTLRKIGDTFRFEPGDALNQAINYRWTGPGKDIAAGGPLARDAGAPGDHPPLTGAEDKPLRKVAWAPIDPTDVGGPPKREEPQRQTPPPPPVPAPPPPASDVETSAAAEGPDDVSAMVDDLTYESMHQAADAPPPARKPARPPSSRRQDQADARKPLLIALGIALILVAAFLGYRQLSGGDAETSVPTVAETTDPAVAETSDPPAGGEATTDSLGQAAGQTPPAGEGETAGQEAPEQTDSETGRPASPDTAPAQSGGTLDPNSDGYTLVVGSTTSMSGARQALQRYASMDMPTGILSYPDSDGQTRHRIAVGEFATAQAADQARQRLSGLPEGTWVRRIRQ